MKLLVTVPWNTEQIDDLRRTFPKVEIGTATAEKEALHAIQDAEIVFGDMSRQVFLAAKQLRWIQCHGAGVNKLIAIPELIASQVQLTNTRGAHAPTISEHFFGMLISLTRQLPKLYMAQQKREWINWSDWSEKVGTQPISLRGMTLGIIGLGNIGRAIAQRAHAFEMRVIAVDALDVPRPESVSELWTLDNLTELLERSDVVVVTVPGTPQTAGLLGKAQLTLLKSTAYLSVVSRGGVVDENALATMLKTGKLAGAALDVAETEPLPSESPLWDAPNLILTPHCAGKSDSTTAAAFEILQENLASYLSGKPLINLVNKQLGF